MRDERIDEASDRSPEQLENRARALARLRGEPGDEYSTEDMQQARREISGEQLPTHDSGNEKSDVGLIRDPSEPPASRGHQVEDVSSGDEQEDAERLALEGVDAAERERMLAARRERGL